MPGELIDVCDERGEHTGERLPKSEIHRVGAWHRAAHVWILTPRGIVLQRRAPTKDTYPNMRDISAAGHINAGEEPLDGAMREVWEELGIALVPEQLAHIGTVREQMVLHGGAYLNNEFSDVFLVRMDVTLDTLALQREEVDAVEELPLPDFWTLVDNVESDLVPHQDEFVLLRTTLSESTA